MQSRLPNHWVIRPHADDGAISGDESDSHFPVAAKEMKWTRVMTRQ